MVLLKRVSAKNLFVTEICRYDIMKERIFVLFFTIMPFGGIGMFEAIQYENDLPVNMKLYHVQEYPLHYNDDIQLLCVMKGFLDLKLTCNTYHLEESDIHFIHGGDLHGIIRSSEDNLVLVISLNTKSLIDRYPDLHCQIFTTKVDKNLVTYQKKIELRNDIFRILSELYRKHDGYQARIDHAVTNLIDNLYENFRGFRVDDDDKTFEGAITGDVTQRDRIARIVDYLYDYYPYKLSLEELAGKEHLNKDYLSHMFSRYTGQSFKNFLNMVRVEMSERRLLGSTVSITQLAMESGFSKPKYYVEHFIKWYGMHPKKYRELYRDKTLASCSPVIEEIPLEQFNVLLDGGALANEPGVTVLDLESLPKSKAAFHVPSIMVNNHSLSESFLDELFMAFYKRNKTANYVFEDREKVPSLDTYRNGYSPAKEAEQFLHALTHNKAKSIPFFDHAPAGGMVTENGLIKPLYYLMQFLTGLSGQIFFCDKGAIVLKDADDYAWIFFGKDGKAAHCYEVTFPLCAASYKLTHQTLENPFAFYELWQQLDLESNLGEEDKRKINESSPIKTQFKRITMRKKYKASFEVKPGSLLFGTLIHC